MKNLLRTFLLGALATNAAWTQVTGSEVARWKRQAQRITILRDDWGLPHIYGKTDADAVFGLIYAQAEDDFNRIETNYLNALGRLAEAEGEAALYQDLRMKLFIDPADLKRQFETSPMWLKALMTAWADALNYYLHTHPTVAPRVIRRFEPWMPLSFSEGSIGNDIERINIGDLKAFYGPKTLPQRAALEPWLPQEPVGSNGIAIAPTHTASGKALLLINPHTSFFFRAELQAVSEEGLNAYGAVTWGQFFVYQGFNDRIGWMHTSSGVDAIDEYRETIEQRANGFFYKYGSAWRPVQTREVVVPYRTPNGMARKTFTIYRTHHGPIVGTAKTLVQSMPTKLKNAAETAAEGRQWIALRLLEAPLKALTQSYSRMKARTYAEFRKTLDLHTNSSNNTIYADADGTTAYFHANFIPKRDPKFDWRKPVDGSDPATEWGAPLTIDESPLVVNPSHGWLYNTNNWPYTAAGPDSPQQKRFPSYVEGGDENPRGLHVLRLLANRKDFTLESLIAAAYDSYLPAFADLIPGLIKAYDAAQDDNPLKAGLADQIKALRPWDFRWSTTSVPTSLAIFWGEELWRRTRLKAEAANRTVYDYIRDRTSGQEKLEALLAASNNLTTDFHTWETPWGDINRFQRLTGAILQPFNDEGPSLPVGFTSGVWGSLAAFGTRVNGTTKKRYGTTGNSFVAVVEFGDKIRARAITAGGESGDPNSPHFNDQAARYASGDLREVYFYRDQLQGHTQREYHPGQ